MFIYQPYKTLNQPCIKNKPDSLLKYPCIADRQPHNVTPATVGSVQQRFHCSSCGRNECLVIACCTLSDIQNIGLLSHIFMSGVFKVL
jgi:hypothetical protein